MGATKGAVRQWLADGWVVKVGKASNRLALDDTFLEASLQIRTPFILAVNGTGGVGLRTIFDTELGPKDTRLADLLATSTPLDIIKDIAARHKLPYDLRKFGLFG